ncbi:acyl-CoA synthetase [Mycobacterium decipiens]|uniref:Long-chain-fatty-acid--CoA ligase FadD13 n=1 Tax=Mycobacterium decipiens TaxID=1430326 RepID=A0A1X2M116_9MYCO|nr:long-chain fatty acid--CoA ligase [Mycobacterium decipiens]OSC43242.1 long-chain fatty acid--CoA ligase [Mycobacterium decipiens]
MKNIGSMLRQRASVSPRLEAYVEPSTNVRMNYAEMNALANRCANVLTSLGIAKGDRVGLLMPNSVEFCCLFYGAAKIGAVAVPLNTRLAAPEVSFILSDSGSKVVIYGAASATVVDAIRAETDPPRTVTDWVPVGDGIDSLGERLRSAAANEPTCDCGGDDNLFIMYTSGTTGNPKGVVHTHDSVHAAASSWSSTVDVRYRDRLLLPLPMFHVAALTTVIFSAMRGVSLISMPQFDATKVWSLIVDERVCIGGAVPAILNFMRQVPEFAELNAPDFRYFITGGAPMPEALIKMYAAKSIEVVQGYALTESCGGGTLLLGEDALRKAGSAGRATMFTDVAVRSDDGVICERGEGEVVIKSDILLKEYWNRPDATRDAFDNGWFRTGDIGEIDEEGYLYIKDRLKDMIISGGENVYPAEIESVIIGIPGVSEVAVIGLTDEKWGEIACAIVVADQSEVSEQQIVEFCGARLARYKLPKKVIFAETIPRNPTGKILKRILREQYSVSVPT